MSQKKSDSSTMPIHWEYAHAPESTDHVQYEKQYGLFINGAFTNYDPSKSFDSVNPATGELLYQCTQANEKDVDAAVKAARKAHEEHWGSVKGSTRGKYLYRIARMLQERAREFAVLESLDGGKPIRESRDIDIPLAAAYFFYYAGWADKLAYAFPAKKVTPLGVCGQIIPWNFPLLMLAWKIAPALACGNTVVLKPAETTSLTALKFCELLQDIGLPNGVVNLITGPGQTGEDLVNHDGIDKIAFTGSTGVGKKIQQSIAGRNIKSTLELGGKGGNIVFSDSHPEAVREGVRNIMSNSGQSCDAPTRMLVEKSIYKRAIEEAADEANKIKVDIASKNGNHIGPVISKTQYDKIIDLINSGINEGATLVAGGPEKPNGLEKGYFVRPTIFTDVTNNMRIAKEEIFGPVLSIIPFEDEDEAISIVNDTSYGLGNYVQTQDKEKAKRVARKFRSGGVYINGNSADPGTPFGGYRQSGNGREGGDWGLEEYLEIKTICGWE